MKEEAESRFDTEQPQSSLAGLFPSADGLGWAEPCFLGNPHKNGEFDILSTRVLKHLSFW